jgi:hypothetical protein
MNARVWYEGVEEHIIEERSRKEDTNDSSKDAALRSFMEKHCVHLFPILLYEIELWKSGSSRELILDVHE